MMKKLVFGAFLALLAGCSSAQDSAVNSAVSATCDELSALQALIPAAELLATPTPAVQAALKAAQLASQAGCASAPALEAATENLAAALQAAK